MNKNNLLYSYNQLSSILNTCVEELKKKIKNVFRKYNSIIVASILLCKNMSSNYLKCVNVTMRLF